MRSIYRCCAASLVLLSVGTGPAPAGADGKAGDACRAAARHPEARIVRRGMEAVVWSRELSNGATAYYGCAYGRGRGGRITDLGGARLRLAGRWLAYVYEGSAIGDDSSKIALVNLGTGRHRRVQKLEPDQEGADPEIDNGASILAFVVTARGQMAWLHGPPRVGTPDGAGRTVRIADGAPTAERIAGRGPVAQRSFRLTRDRRSVTWVADGVRRVARLR